MGVVVDTDRQNRRFSFGSPRAWIVGSCIIGGLGLLGCGAYFVFGLLMPPTNVADVVAKVNKSVVAVYCGDSMGTGVVMNVPRPDNVGSVIITAAHVFDACEEGGKVGVEYQGHVYKATLVSKDPASSEPVQEPAARVDLARIDLAKEIPGLDPAPPARVGDWSVVVGNPLDHINYASFGIVSSVQPAFYETTAPVNEGNSGGPMVDARGRVLGIVSTYTVKAGLFDANAVTVYDQAAGIAQVMRLSRACPHIYNGASNCPFKD